jgi:hypothetical protein
MPGSLFGRRPFPYGKAGGNLIEMAYGRIGGKRQGSFPFGKAAGHDPAAVTAVGHLHEISGYRLLY